MNFLRVPSTTKAIKKSCNLKKVLNAGELRVIKSSRELGQMLKRGGNIEELLKK